MRESLFLPPEGKDGTTMLAKTRAKCGSNCCRCNPSGPVFHHIKFEKYNIAPNAIESYQSGKPIRKSQSNGIVILDVLWANNMKGEEIYVGEDEMGDTKEEDNSAA